ncbi:MAG: glycine cleavage system protein GcvH [Chloroflexi bacterium]|nr:glycine cleavage system protein GcvH [Chloroflexota bacterium]
MHPDDRHYSREHEWVKRADDGTVWIGITQYAQDQLGDLVFFELPQVGVTLGQMQKLGEVESVKSISDIFSPISGEVLEVNQNVVEHPEVVNEDQYEQGWLVHLRPSDPAEIDQLMSAADYESFLESLDH